MSTTLRRWGPGRWGPRRWGRAGLVLAGLLIGLLAAELISRALGGAEGDFLLAGAPSAGTAALIEPDPRTLWRLRPDAHTVAAGVEFRVDVRTNSLGLRGPEPGPPGPLRVLALGDSFTLGAQVPEDAVVSSRLADLLTTQHGRPVEVHNGGVDGFGTRQAIAQLERLAGPLRPQVTVLFFFLGNDPWENARFQQRRAELAAGGGGKKKAPPLLTGWLLTHSHLFSRLRATWSAWTGDVPESVRERYVEELQRFTTTPAPDGFWEQTGADLHDFDSTCRRLQQRCLLVLAPPAFVVAEQRAAVTFQAFGLDPATLDLGAPARQVESLRPPGLPVLDLTPALRAAADAGARPYFAYDGHWTAAGHDVAAQATAQALLPLLPGGRP